MQKDTAIQVEKLHKSYGKLTAVQDISFSVRKNEIFGIVGPNGAGKTTTIECLEGLRSPDKGLVRVLGLDPQKNRRSLHERIGVQLQESRIASQIKVWEVLDLYTALYSRTVDYKDLLEKLQLSQVRSRFYSRLSGGQKQRLFIALSLINDPEIVFFDELTTGLDPQARRVIWDLVREVNESGKTVVLTTHFMEEAERLCDRVLIMDHGRIITLDSPENLVKKLGAEHKIIFSIKGRVQIESFNELATVEKVSVFRDKVTISGKDQRLLADVVNHLIERRIPYYDLQTQQPNLDDVFISLTGKEIRK
ncbi:MAG: ATP-binding cassette domain-containing protein [Candidatus Aminicenantes bacterium]|nr:ATP-binding cassette domain-containing protein [Candidatus Aminicenantes bacterium]